MANDVKRTGDLRYRWEKDTLNFCSWTNPIVGAAVDLTDVPEVGKRFNDGLETEWVDEVQFVVPSPVDTVQLIKFLRQARLILQYNIVQITGSPSEGCTVMVHLAKPALLADILAKLKEVYEVEPAQDRQLATDCHPQLPTRVAALRETDSHGKTIYVNLMKN